MTYAQRRKTEIFKEINEGKCSIGKVKSTARTLSFKACPSKIKMDMETAAERWGRYPEEVNNLYICPRCNFVHASHERTWDKTAITIIVKKKEARKRNSGVQTPKWKLDPRRTVD